MSGSKQNEQGDQGDAAKEKTEQPLPQTETAVEETAQSLKIGLQYETEYIAPLHRYDGVPLIPDHYSVTFHKGHTRQKHWEAIGEDLGAPGAHDWYQVTLTDEQLERIRRDPGVKKVTQSGRGVWD
jgi:hypothetical protein